MFLEAGARKGANSCTIPGKVEGQYRSNIKNIPTCIVSSLNIFQTAK